MYFGEHQTVVDDKGRITFPRRFREVMDILGHTVWHMTTGFDGCVFLFHQDEWNTIRKQVSRYSSMNAKALDFRRLLYGSVAKVQADRQGRVPVPAHLREHAGLEREAVLIGVDEHLELWSKEAWRAFQSRKEAEFKEMATQLFVGDERTAAATEKEGASHED